MASNAFVSPPHAFLSTSSALVEEDRIDTVSGSTIRGGTGGVYSMFFFFACHGREGVVHPIPPHRPVEGEGCITGVGLPVIDHDG